MTMLKSEIEAKVLKVVEDAEKGSSQEDSFIELKAIWFDQSDEDAIKRFAYQLAAHANAARGEAILWVIGVKQHKGIFGDGVPSVEIGGMLAQLSKYFDGPPPQLVTDIVISPHGDKSVLALQFETDRPPYVHKLEPAKKHSKLEVPWREGTAARSAGHNDLIRILVPATRLPSVDILTGNVKVRARDSSTSYDADMPIRLFVAPRTRDLITVVNHLSSASLEWEAAGVTRSTSPVEFFADGEGSRAIEVTRSSATIHSATELHVNAKFDMQKIEEYPTDSMPTIVVNLGIVGAHSSIPIHLKLMQPEDIRERPHPNDASKKQIYQIRYKVEGRLT